MTTVGDIAQKVRSKNAARLWLTIDVFCGSEVAYARIVAGVSSDRVAALFKCDPAMLKRFDMPELHVVKFSLPRPQVQGSLYDRDMHGAGWAPLLAEMAVN